MKLYLAGPDVFRADVQAWADEARALCRAHGHEALVPLDGDATSASEIYVQNLDLIAQADAVLANLNPFRGVEPDSGTCFEVGYACALGKPVIGYIAYADTVAERVARWQGGALRRDGERVFDRNGEQVENFGLPANLMLAVPACIVSGGLAEALMMLGDAPA